MTKFWDLLKNHWENCPVALFLVMSWSILPGTCRLLVLGFVLQILVYDYVKWKYEWPVHGSKLASKKFLKGCHWGFLASLILIPLVSMAAYHLQKEVPKQLDSFVISSGADKFVTNQVTAFVFTNGIPQPTNYSVSYFGIVSSTDTRLFASDSFFSSATAKYIKSLLAVGAGVWVLAWVAFYVFAFSETIAETMQPPNGPTGNTPANAP